MRYCLSIVVVFLFLFCSNSDKKKSNSQKIIDFKLIHQIELPLPKGIDKFNINGCKLFITKEDSILVIPFISNKRIVFYSITNKQIIKDIDISFVSTNNLSNFYCFSIDSFLLTYTYHGYSFEENLNDSLIYILTLKNNKINVYNNFFPKSNYFCIKKDEFKDSSFVYPTFNNNQLFLIGENKLIVPYNRLSIYSIGTDEFVRLNVPTFGFLDINKKKIVDADFLDYPYVKNNVFYPSDIKDKYYCVNKNKLYVRYFYSGSIFILDSNAHYVEKKELKSLLIDSVFPFKEARSNHWGRETINSLYLQINYDKFRKLFYSYIYFPYQRYGKGFFSMIIADSLLNYINELVYDIKLSYHSIFTEKYIISITVKEDKIELKYYQPVSKEISKEEYEEYIKNIRDSINKMEALEKNKVCKVISNTLNSNSNNITDYILNVQKIKEATFACVYLYTDMVCESCVHSVLFDFMINRNNYEKLPIFLHLSGSNKNVNKVLEQYFLKSYKNLYIDTNSVYKYFDPFNNATVRMVLYSNNQIQSDTIYTPQGLDTMMNRCFHFFEKKM